MSDTGIKTDNEYRILGAVFKWGISAPGLAAQLIFGWFPLIIGILASFQDFKFQGSEWCGMKNYETVISDPMASPFSYSTARTLYATSVRKYNEKQGRNPGPLIKAALVSRACFLGVGKVWRNTLYYAALSLGLTFFIPILVSILLMEMKPWVIRIMMILWFFPIAGMASLVLLKFFYNVDYGLLNGLIAKFYDLVGTPMAERVFPRWLNSPTIAMLCLILPGIIMYSPGMIYIANLTGMSQDLYDAAEIDGCGFFRKILHVTLPRMRPLIVTMLVFSILASFQAMGDVMILTGGGPGNSTMVMGYYIYKLTFDYLEIGRGNALAMIFFVFLMILTALQRRYIREDNDKSTPGEDPYADKVA